MVQIDGLIGSKCYWIKTILHLTNINSQKNSNSSRVF